MPERSVSASTERLAANEAGSDPESLRLAEARGGVAWKRWGPYLAERAWGTVREDYSPGGDAWRSFGHSDARQRAYRWSEDGLLGISDDQQRLCVALCLWNERDPILKERLFGLTNPEGNHGEDVKELYFYLDALPSAALLRAAYLYPQREFPYTDLVRENARRAGHGPEYELLDTGVLDDDRFFDVEVVYAKAGPEAIVLRVRATNRGPDPAPLHLLPMAWFRNTWAWEDTSVERPSLRVTADGVVAEHPTLGRYRLAAEADDAPIEWLFTDNETNEVALYGSPPETAARYTKDAVHRYLVAGESAAVNPEGIGTRAAAHARWIVPPGGTAEIRLALVADGVADAAELAGTADAVITARTADADRFYEALAWPSMSAEERLVQRQALAGLLWSFEYYAYDVARWRRGDRIAPPAGHAETRNREWGELRAAAVLSVPDTWEYPWFAAWDLAFQAVTLGLVDPDRAKEQLLALLDDRLLHPSGQIPAYEWEFSDPNPPVQAWAALRVYGREKHMTGHGDRAFLERMLHGLTLNFGWWVNRRDRDGRNLFEGGFLGLDNISILDRSAIEAAGETLDQADATGWIAFFALGLTEMALELALEEPVYVELAKHFLGRFVAIGEALARVGGEGLWDPDQEFFFDLLRQPGHVPTRLRAFSIAGLVPLFATRVLDPELLERVPGFAAYLRQLAGEQAHFFGACDCFSRAGPDGRWLLALVDQHRLSPILDRMLGEDRFLSPHGVRSVSRRHRERDLPVDVTLDGMTSRVEYEPAEAETRIKGGNSNWRGPVWFPLNYLLWQALRQYGRYYGEMVRHPLPSDDGAPSDLRSIAEDIGRRLVTLYLPAPDGRRPAQGPDARWRDHPAFRNRLLFFEYFHGETGQGLGASHQTGWTALIANLIDELHRPSSASGMSGEESPEVVPGSGARLTDPNGNVGPGGGS